MSDRETAEVAAVLWQYTVALTQVLAVAIGQTEDNDRTALKTFVEMWLDDKLSEIVVTTKTGEQTIRRCNGSSSLKPWTERRRPMVENDMVWVITIIILGFVLMGAVLWVVWIGVAVSETAMKSKAKKLSLALGYADYRDAQLGLAKTRSYRMVPASDVFHALQNEQHRRSTKDRGMKRCPACDEPIRQAATKCRYCGEPQAVATVRSRCSAAGALR